MFSVIFLILLTQQFATKGELIKDPSLKPADPFIVSDDAEVIKKEIHNDACTNRDKLAKIIFHRTIDQRIQLYDFYNEKYFAYVNRYGKRVYSTTLYWDLLYYSTDSLQKLYKLAFKRYEAQLGDTLHSAIAGEWKEGGVVEEIVCANDKEMKDLIQEHYKAAFQCTVEDHLKLIHKDDKAYQETIHKYCWQPLCQEKKMKPEDIDKEAKALQDIDPKKDKEGFKKKLKELLDKNCEPDLKEIFNKYKKDKHRISDGVDEAFDGDEKTAFNVLVRYIENTCMFYADELYHAVDGCGTDIDKINRIVLTRCERDMLSIFNEYKNKRGETFTERLDGDTTEDRYLESIRYLCGKP
ncbi:annexin A2-like [Planococcus citri]|uniref:annexin A2-like n=1 Tax=Planococcus citri TaxID=170843 RepID=UPI0031F77480